MPVPNSGWNFQGARGLMDCMTKNDLSWFRTGDLHHASFLFPRDLKVHPELRSLCGSVIDGIAFSIQTNP
jgi:hypothetical protein